MKGLILALLSLAALALAAGLPRGGVDASDPGAMPAPLVSCPNLDGDANGFVRAADISLVVQAFFHDAPMGFPNVIDSDYVFLYDRTGHPVTGGPDGKLRAADISNVVRAFFTTCPLVDTEVAQATQWALNNAPATESYAALAAMGYDTASEDSPGQGVHYTKFENFLTPGFDAQAPEGLVYVDGRLAAQLYFVAGDFLGWMEDPYSATPGSCSDGLNNSSTPPHGDSVADAADPDCSQSDPGIDPTTSQPYPPLDDVNIDALAGFCFGSCSWSGSEGWHLHYRLCTYHTDTPNTISLSLPVGSDAADCADLNATGCGCGGYSFGFRVGWMGHLWNHLPNGNLLPDANSTMNGRFADCYPDAEGWKAYNCPQ